MTNFGAKVQELEQIVLSVSAEAQLSSRSFSLIKEDLDKSFAYVQPNRDNLATYGSRYFEIIFRCCVEFEILSKKVYEIIFQKDTDNLNISELSKIYPYLKLDGLRVIFREWDSGRLHLNPLEGWNNEPHGLNWFRFYNKLKHDRHKNFQSANLENAINASAGLFMLLNHLTSGSYITFTHTHLDVGIEFVFYDSPFSILAPPNWSPPRCLDSTPDAA